MSGLSGNLSDQDRRFTFVSAALPASTFDVVNISGLEAISKNFSFELILVCDLEAVSFDDMLANPATLTIFAPNAKSPTPYHGVLGEFEQLQAAGNYVFYRAVLQPRLQAFGQYRTSDVYIDGKSIPDVITDVLTHDQRMVSGIDFDFKVTKGNYPDRDFVCQYQESDLEFVQRWMEREGIYYYFDHSGKVEKLVMVDATIRLPEDPPKALSYRPNETVQTDKVNNSLQSLVCKQKPLPQHVTLRGFNFTKASSVLEETAEVSAKGKGRVMLYGESFLTDAECGRYAGIRAQEIACQGTVFEGRASAVGLRSGYFLMLKDHYRTEWNDIVYLVTEIQHEGSQAGALLKGLSTPFGPNTGETTYSANFKAIAKKTPFRPERTAIKPYVAGTVTAVIDGDVKATYADVDDTGRYRVMFPFCKAGKEPSKRSARVRMAMPYSGPGYGMNFPLHVGAEVMVSFLDGDPDQPVIVNAVPNSENPNVITDKNYMLGMIKTAAGNALTFDDTKDEQSSTVYSPLGSSRWRIGQKAADQRGVVASQQLTWGDARRGLHGQTEEDISLSAGKALVLSAGDGAGVATPQLNPQAGDFQLASKFGLMNVGEQQIKSTRVDGTLDVYAKHINMYAEPSTVGGVTTFGYMMISGTPSPPPPPPGPPGPPGAPPPPPPPPPSPAPAPAPPPAWTIDDLYARQHWAGDVASHMGKDSTGYVTTVNQSATKFTQGDSNSATYGHSSSITRGNSTKLTWGTDLSHSMGMSSSLYFGMKNDMFAGIKNSLSVGASSSISVSADLKVALSAVADFSFGVKVGFNGAVDGTVKSVEAKAAGVKLEAASAEILSKITELKNDVSSIISSGTSIDFSSLHIVL